MSSSHPELIFLRRYASRSFASHSGSILRSSSSSSSSSISRGSLPIVVLHDSEELESAAPLLNSLSEFSETLQRANFENCICLLVVEPYLEPRGRQLVEIGTKRFD